MPVTSSNIANLSEPYITAVMARMESTLNDYVDALNSVVTDGFTLDHVASNAFLDYPPPVAMLSQFPTIGLQDGEIGFADDVGWSATSHGDLTIIAFDQDDDQRALAWKLRRWNRVLASCVLKDRRLPPEGWGVILKGISPGPTLGREENPRTWMSFTAMTINVRAEQDAW